MAFDLFLLEVVISGLMTGVMYALVALGFVLIFKASGIFNFAQGVLALFAALALFTIFSSRTDGSSAFSASPCPSGWQFQRRPPS